jgi:cell division protein FtsW
MGAMSFQPSELAKPALILFLAFFLERRLKSIDDLRHTLLPAIVPCGLFAILIVKQPDLGTAMVCVGVTAAILYAAGMRLRYFGYALVPIVPALYFLLFHVGWRARRMVAFLDPWSDPQGAGFHITQSLIAVGTGGLTGLGLMEGKQKLFYLPEPHTDFIYAVASEELGLVGAVFIATLFLILAWRGFRTALRTEEPFARLLAIGITTMVVLQAFFNISVVLALLPTKGIPLPFISYGGSSLFVMLASIGVLLNITRETE